MIDADAVNAALKGSGWVVATDEDPNVQRHGTHPVTGHAVEVNETAYRIVATKGDETLYLSPSHTAEELALVLREHDALAAHGHHTEPVFDCPDCRADHHAASRGSASSAKHYDERNLR